MSNAVMYGHVIATCLALAVITVILHMFGLFVLRRWIRRILQNSSFSHHIMRETVLVSLLVISLCMIHTSEVVMWAIGYNSIGAISGFDNAFYYSLVTYTSLGAEGISVGPLFRLIAGFESLLGPMMLAWSTAFLVEHVSQVTVVKPSEHGNRKA